MDDEDVGEGAAAPVAGEGSISVIAVPLAGSKLTKRMFKVCKKAAASKMLKRGVKEVVKALRKGEKGLCLLAGDISPVDVISHLPVLCEDQGVPYVFVPSKAELGAAAGTKRPTSCILVPASGKPGKGGVAFDAASKLKELMAEVTALAPST